MPELSNRDSVLTRFHLLMEFLLKGTLQGSLQGGKFEPWEMDILLDVESQDLRGVTRRDLLRDYQNAVEAELQTGAPLALRFSEYLEWRAQTRAERKPAKPAAAAPAKRKGARH